MNIPDPLAGTSLSGVVPARHRLMLERLTIEDRALLHEMASWLWEGLRRGQRTEDGHTAVELRIPAVHAKRYLAWFADPDEEAEDS